VISPALRTPTMRTLPALLPTSTAVMPSSGTLSVTVRWLWASANAVLQPPNSSIGTASIVPTIRQASFVMAATSTVQPPQHGEHAPVVVLGGRQVQLGEDVGDVLLDSPVAHDQLAGDGVVAAALGHQAEDFALARRQPLQRILSPGASQPLGHHLAVE